MNTSTRVLIVEDDDALRALLTEGLTRAGYAVEVARDGEECLKLMKTTPPDIVVTDIIMPRSEGIELIRALRAERPDLPIIAVSGGGRLSADWHLQVAVNFGADGALRKPFKVKDLVAEIDRALAVGGGPRRAIC